MDSETLDRECTVFCRYLIGKEPNDYVKRKYREAHRIHSQSHMDYANPADRFLVQIARSGRWSTKIVDAYARVFGPCSLIRKKLVLLLAILESCAPTHGYLDSVDFGYARLLLQSLQGVLSFALMVAVATVVILPLELAVRGGARIAALCLPRNG